MNLKITYNKEGIKCIGILHAFLPKNNDLYKCIVQTENGGLEAINIEYITVVSEKQQAELWLEKILNEVNAFCRYMNSQEGSTEIGDPGDFSDHPF